MADKKKVKNEEGEEGGDDFTVVAEDGSDSAPMRDAGRTAKRLKEKLELCEKERQEYLDGWQRARADFANARKEEEKARVELGKYIREEMLVELIAALDSFELAFANKESWEKVDENWRKGVEYIYSQLLSTLASFGLEEIEPRGKAFDPNLHASIESVPVERNEDDGNIVAVVQKGYMANGKVLRPAQVKVGSFIKKENE